MLIATERARTRVVAALGPARIGPNAITRMAEALDAFEGPALRRHVFDVAGLSHYLLQPPTHMVDEDDVTALFTSTWMILGPESYAQVTRDAGHRTGDYLLANRIPAGVQAVLRWTPKRLAASILLSAIARHAWTFVGSGTFHYETQHLVTIRITRSPLCRRIVSAQPVCDYYAATFERIFRKLVSAASQVDEIACGGRGSRNCLFVITL